MACVQNAQRRDSEMEEGEIVDELDDLSDISSEEEFLLRQRLRVLENYNNVLERKKAKHSTRPGSKRRNDPLDDLSDISGDELDDYPKATPQVQYSAKGDFRRKTTPKAPKNSLPINRNNKNGKPLKPHDKPRKIKESQPIITKNKECKKKYRKKRLEVTVLSETSESEESEDEYRNKRRKLANAVVVNQGKGDTSSLQARLKKMLNGLNFSESIKTLNVNKQIAVAFEPRFKDACCSPLPSKRISINPESEDVISATINTDSEVKDVILVEDDKENKPKLYESIDLSTDDDVLATTKIETASGHDSVSCSTREVSVENPEENKKDGGINSDDDLELLRQHALKTKSSKNVKPLELPPTEPQKNQSEDEDSDTAELRLICLKSALLKKAIENKQKFKLRKRLSQSVQQDEFNLEDDELYKKIESENNTDIESVDMEIGSDGDEKTKDGDVNKKSTATEQCETADKEPIDIASEPKSDVIREEELEEDEDLLRARLLTSLSKNLPNLVDPSILEAFDEPKKPEPATASNNNQNIPVPEKRIVINVGESDSEGEHEATKNLTKMHMKLSERKDFQQKLDMFLKSARMEVEKEKLPDVVEQPLPKTPQKFVAKAVNHLPKSEQMEYKNLVKRMAELEKIKQARQVTMSVTNRVQVKDTLKPRNDSNAADAAPDLEEQISLSRKNIAEESARMLQLKEEATKLFQKYKIVATELRNISTAITLNKKEQRSVQNRLARKRAQHQKLFKSSISRHSKLNNNKLNPINQTALHNRTQKENPPFKGEYKNADAQKSLTISVINDLNKETPMPVATRLSIELDISSNKKTVTSTSVMEQSLKKSSTESEKLTDERDYFKERKDRAEDDYESPLQALGGGTWEADPNEILCRFEIGGHCKDPHCKYLHPKPPSHP